MITIQIGKPRRSKRDPATDTSSEPIDIVETADSIFTPRNFVILGAGVALGIILKQQGDIRTLKKTVVYLQGTLRHIPTETVAYLQETIR